MGSTRQNYWVVDVGTIVLFSIVATKLLVHLYASRNYGYFVADLGRRSHRWPAADAAAPMVPDPVDLDRWPACFSDLPSKSGVELSTSFPFSGAAGEYPPQRPQRGSHAAFVFWSGGSVDASNDAADLAGWTLVFSIQ